MNKKEQFEAKFPMRALFDPCSEEDLLEYQRTLMKPLPSDYLQFLRQWNGVMVGNNPGLFPLMDARDEDDVGMLWVLYGIGPEDDCDDLRSGNDGYDFKFRVPSHFLAIGENNSWDRICLSLGDDTYGYVYYWEPGEPWEPDGINKPTMDYMSPVAMNFREFWDLLYEDEHYWEG